ncbi:hypothetical protein CDAR_185511 [Caerostris darwini]|uniref:Uncharacterized protein n=1 Tax=Caerostris darwini TaxID=1538125 RepID=A0AAV4NF38_9ARAC|nr:hypothetical protein CDAR_185511 [Caerostris darwini]
MKRNSITVNIIAPIKNILNDQNVLKLFLVSLKIKENPFRITISSLTFVDKIPIITTKAIIPPEAYKAKKRPSITVNMTIPTKNFFKVHSFPQTFEIVVKIKKNLSHA